MLNVLRTKRAFIMKQELFFIVLKSATFKRSHFCCVVIFSSNIFIHRKCFNQVIGFSVMAKYYSKSSVDPPEQRR